MHRFFARLHIPLLATLGLLLASPAAAWNAAGHRLVAHIAWQQLSPASRTAIAALLAHHPDHERWANKARDDDPAAVFAEAATWADDIRNDPRFHDGDAPPETARHKKWHFQDVDRSGRIVDGEIERRINELALLLRSNGSTARQAWALPWLIHLIGDIHQPLHVGRAEDEGGTRFEIENPFNHRRPFSSLHAYWDDLPGPPWLRGARLQQTAARLIDAHSPPPRGTPRQWGDESRRLEARVYPEQAGSLLPTISEPFHQRAQHIADRRLVDAGYRLGWLLDEAFGGRVPRETR